MEYVPTIDHIKRTAMTVKCGSCCDSTGIVCRGGTFGCVSVKEIIGCAGSSVTVM